MKKYLGVIMVILLLSCNKQIEHKEINKELSRTYNMSYDKIWDNLILWNKTNNTLINYQNKEEGLLHFEKVINNDSIWYYTDFKPDIFNNDFYNVHANVYILLKKIKDSIRVDVLASYNGKIDIKIFFFNGQKTESNTVSHHSSGMLEKNILNYLSEKGK